MCRGFRRPFLSIWLPVLLAGCTARAEAVRAAQPYIKDFGELRSRGLKLLELRFDVERRRLLAKALQADAGAVPDNLRPILERMRAERVQISDQELEHGEALFWRMLDYAFSDNPNVLQAEIVLLDKDGSVSRFRYPRERELPAGVKWYGLREPRVFTGLADCVTDEGSEACVLLQLRPRDYVGSAGLTVAYRRTPLEVKDDGQSGR